MAEEKTLDDTTIEEFYKLGEELRGIPEEKYMKGLKGILYEEITKHFHEKKDKETHELTWESDEQIKAFTDNLWDKAADHVAEHYLKMGEETKKKLQDAKDPDDPSQTQFEAFIAQYLGISKEDFFETLKSKPTMNPENILEYLTPIYNEHLKVRSSKKVGYRLKKPEDAIQLLDYMRLVKEHNPKTVKLRIPKHFKSIQETAGLYTQLLSMIPETYHPKKPDTYAKK